MTYYYKKNRENVSEVNEKPIEPNITLRFDPKEISPHEITSAEDAANVMKNIVQRDREEFRVLHLNSKNRVIGSEVVSVGTLNSALVHPREVFKGAIINNSNAILVAHNHPSGNPEPSPEDIKVCTALTDSGKLLGIHVLDCLILAGDKFKSIKEEI